MSGPPPQATALYQVREVFKTYSNGDEETPVLKGVNMEMARGEMVALEGPSGSGKSTLLSILGLLLQPSSGELVLDGQSLKGLKERAIAKVRGEKLGFVFQFHHLLPDFSALENVAFPAAAPAGGISRAMRTRAAELLDRVGLSDRKDFRPSRLSGGQKQRVAIARALMNQPLLVLADEPTGNLDRESSDQVLKLMREINAQEATTFLICTHDHSVAERCDRRVHMLDGQIERVD
jgi:lipoprotein-releasing system ATP-binding protein